jgi:vacuolar protein sorting-associated protein 13A/C
MDAVKDMLVNKVDHQHILKPVSGEARLVIHQKMTNTTPKIDIQAFFDEIGVVLDRAQYRDVLSLLDVFHFYSRTHHYYKYRPPEEEYEANPAKARWKYALRAISSEVHERRRRWTWTYFAERRDKRIKYVDLYVKKLALPEGQNLPPEDEAALAELERGLSYEDIRFFRSVARVTARRDAETRNRLEAETKPHDQTWSQWLWGASDSTKTTEGITEKEQKEIDDLIDYDTWTANEASSSARDVMQTRMSVTLNKGSFSLRTDPHGSNKDVIALVFDSFSADVLQLTDSMQGKLALGGFRVYDDTTPNSLYPQIVRVKDVGSTRPPFAKQRSLDVGGTHQAMAELSSQVEPGSEPFFVVEFDHNPLDGRADNAVTVKMRHLEIIYHRNYVQEVLLFFKPPASQLESLSAFLDAAGETLDGIRSQTRAGLEYALEQHRTLDLHVDMNAPIIVLPME